jgi:hypothetical protein
MIVLEKPVPQFFPYHYNIVLLSFFPWYLQGIAMDAIIPLGHYFVTP